MPEYYYQIKTKSSDEYQFRTWAFPPLISGKVTAISKKEARILIQEEYGRAFPLKVLHKDLENEQYLLCIQEILDEDERTKSIFEFRECKQCGQRFRRIDLYNDHNEIYKGIEYCGQHCKEVHRLESLGDQVEWFSKSQKPIVYQITNIKSGLSYIGKTTQVFTLRWYQHFFQRGTCKFHQAISESKPEDWQFQVIETAIAPVGVDQEMYLAERERFWISQLNTVAEGYNSI